MKALSGYLRSVATGLALLSLVLFALQAIFPKALVDTGVVYLLWFMVALSATIGFALAYKDKPRIAALCAGVTTAAFALGEIVHDVALGAMLKGESDFVLMEVGGVFTLVSLGLGAVAAGVTFVMARSLGRST